MSTETKDKYGTIVKPCTCYHEYQDKIYGQGNRLHNLAKKGTNRRCTICKTTVFN